MDRKSGGVFRATALASAAICLAATARPASDAAKTRSSDVISRFMTAVRACGVKPTLTPRLTVETDPGLVSYRESDNTVHVSRWNELPAPTKGLVTEWSKQGTLNLDPPAMFSEIFNSLLVAHELGHYLQFVSGRSRNLDHWQAETEANQIAIAFWSISRGAEPAIAARVSNFEQFLGALPSPVPAGSDPHAYFEANYERLSNDAAAYGWYQGAFMRTAWANRTQRDFCAWVKLNKPDPSVNVAS